MNDLTLALAGNKCDCAILQQSLPHTDTKSITTMLEILALPKLGAYTSKPKEKKVD